MNLKHTALLASIFFICTFASCSGDLEAENAQLKKDLAEAQAQLKEQTKLSDFSKEQATTAKRRADEAEKALAECNASK
ncbi:MAG: hypothetical protein ABJF11_02720 [Reichenbachiella sp.]|uniref:hypothetical protein n=1 Tax=Reichenbachiella sp. TaxID=2184521 RepID=UPI003266C25B